MDNLEISREILTIILINIPNVKIEKFLLSSTVLREIYKQEKQYKYLLEDEYVGIVKPITISNEKLYTKIFTLETSIAQLILVPSHVTDILEFIDSNFRTNIELLTSNILPYISKFSPRRGDIIKINSDSASLPRFPQGNPDSGIKSSRNLFIYDRNNTIRKLEYDVMDEQIYIPEDFSILDDELEFSANYWEKAIEFNICVKFKSEKYISELLENLKPGKDFNGMRTLKTNFKHQFGLLFTMCFILDDYASETDVEKCIRSGVFPLYECDKSDPFKVYIIVYA